MRRRLRRIIVRPKVDLEEEARQEKIKIYTALIAFASTILNISLLFIIGFQTVLPTTPLIVSYFVISLIGFFYFKKKLIKNAALKSYVIFPLLINLILTFNFVFSHSPKEETYEFRRNHYWDYSRTRINSSPNIEMSSIISLKNKAYKDCYGIRTFFSYENIGHTDRITYTFKTGILGIKVMVDYRFN